MKYFLGIDGGGTKTAFLLTEETGRVLAEVQTEGCSYKELGIQKTADRITEGMQQCLAQAGISLTELTAAAIGLPCYGEIRRQDAKVKKVLEQIFGQALLYITNDVEVGWAGSLGLKPGINVVAGTGSIAFGKNQQGETARSGGWSTFFGDEGSCYWLGRRTMELFSRQADGRVRKDKLYHIIRQEFALEEDMDFIEKMDEEYIKSRSKVASLQKLLLQAAKAGDTSARMLYKEAAAELELMVESIAKQLWKEEEQVTVSYSGGLFHAKEFLLPYMAFAGEAAARTMKLPEFSPVQGAVLLAAQESSSADMERIRSNWEKEMR